MKIENHITSILQLYEFSMAIGKSLDYIENCDSFLKLILKRKNLNAAWILENDKDVFTSTYSIPLGNSIKVSSNKALKDIIETSEYPGILTYSSILKSITPIEVNNGSIVFFNLKEQGFLFLYSKKESVNFNDFIKLIPVMDKFLTSIKACKAYKQQQFLLNNLERQNQELSDYAHMVSHDLKSPLRSIDALTSWLKEDYKHILGDKGNDSINLIRNNVEKMDTLINGILDYSTISKNQTEFYDVDTNKLFENIMETMIVPPHISIIKKTHLPIIKGDKYRLQQLFQNLIDNAIKYNDKAEGRIEIDAEEVNEFWKFSIIDNGKGIEEAYFNKIFKTFQKLENSPGSSGIGLSIVKKIVTLYGGKIWLESELNIGTTFYFTIKQ